MVVKRSKTKYAVEVRLGFVCVLEGNVVDDIRNCCYPS